MCCELIVGVKRRKLQARYMYVSTCSSINSCLGIMSGGADRWIPKIARLMVETRRRRGWRTTADSFV